MSIIQFSSRDEWLSGRRAFIGASEVAAIIGKHPWLTPLDVYNQKIYGRVKLEEDPIRLRAGIYMEDFILELFQERFGGSVEKNYYTIYVDDDAFISATPDAFWKEDNEPDKLGIIECKTANFATRYQWGDDLSYDVPLHYYIQAVAQIGAFEKATKKKLSSYYFAVLFDLNQFVVFLVDLNRARSLYSDLAALTRDWWFEHVVAHKEPEPEIEVIENSSVNIKSGGDEELLMADERINEAAIHLLKLKAQLEEVENEIKFYEDKLKIFIGEADGVITAAGIFTWKPTKDQVRIDYQAICDELKPPAELIAKYTKVVPGPRRFLYPRKRTNQSI